MELFNRNAYNQTFVEWAIRAGYQQFFVPANVALPEGIDLNPFGWLPAPTGTNDLIFPLVDIRPDEKRTVYWFTQYITTRSSNVMRFSIERNRVFNNVTGTFEDAEWENVHGITVTADKDYSYDSMAMFKTKAGEALRLRCFPVQGNDNDWYFRFGAIDLPRNEA